MGGIGGVIRNSQSDLIIGFMGGLPNASKNQAELLSLMQGLKITMDQNLTPLKIATDSTEVIDMLHNGLLAYEPIIYECRQLMQQLRNPLIRHTFREQNKVVDALAKEGAKNKLCL